MGDQMTDGSALEKLLAEESEVNENLLSEVLSRYVKIGKGTGLPLFTPDFARLTNAGKILVYLLARKAAAALNLLKEAEPATPKEISEATGVAHNSVKPTLSALARSHVVVRNEGRYSCPSHILSRASELIK